MVRAVRGVEITIRPVQVAVHPVQVTVLPDLSGRVMSAAVVGAVSGVETAVGGVERAVTPRQCGVRGAGLGGTGCRQQD